MKLLCAILTSGIHRQLTEGARAAVSQLSRMFRGPHILAWSCPIRSLLLLREPHLCVLSEQSGAAGQFAKHGKESRIAERGRTKEGSTETVPCAMQPSVFSSDCGNHHLEEASLQNLASQANFSSHHRHHPTLISTSTKDKQASDPWKYTVVEESGQIPKAVSTYQDCLTNTTCLQPWRRPSDKVSLTFTHKTQSTPPQSHLYHRLLNLSASMIQTLNHFHSRTQAYSPIFQQFKAIHQAAPRVVDAWRDCLSPENENRCRQSLGPNLKFYEADKGRKAASQSQGKDQGRWASVLVSLCSVEGQPSFLFTLRSSTLKGRHKGDVSFAGGKSDPSDRDVVATALREAWEELGIHVGTEKVWGVLKPLRDMSGMKIAPVLANLGPIEELSFKPNPGEVEEIFTLSLSHLCNPQNCGYTHFRTGDKYGYTLPVFRNGKHRVWGLTAIALDHTLKLVVPS